MKLSPKMKSALRISGGTILGYLIARELNEDKTLGIMLGTLAGKLADDIATEQPETETTD